MAQWPIRSPWRRSPSSEGMLRIPPQRWLKRKTRCKGARLAPATGQREMDDA